MPLESKIEQDTVRWAESRFILHLKINVRGRRGWPDHLFVYNGRCMFIEFKQPGEKPEPLQEYIINQLRSRRIPVEVHTTTGEACDALERVLFATYSD